jgi:hypothetical protein
MTTTIQPRLKIVLIGLGRLGALRAKILAFEQPRMELVAVCDTRPETAKWAAANLPPSVQFFADPEECMKSAGARAVLISTATATHAALICLALDLDLVRYAMQIGWSRWEEFLLSCADRCSLACYVREADFGGYRDYRGSGGQSC